MTSNTWQIKIHDNLRLVVPADINNFNTYVLLEQEDWCEPEIEFIRIFSEPNLTVLDMDTGCGVYALVFANEMEGEGKVIALNPDEHFEESVQANNNLQSVIYTELDDSPLDFIRLGEADPDEKLIQQGDPLIMFPAKEEHIKYFKDQGLDIYEHIPSINVLAPVEADTPLEGNLFACSQGRAEKLLELELMAQVTA